MTSNKLTIEGRRGEIAPIVDISIPFFPQKRSSFNHLTSTMSDSKMTEKDSKSLVSSQSSQDDSAYLSGDDDSASSDVSFHDEASVDQHAEEAKEVHKLSRWETIGVRFWRTVVLLLLIIAGVLVSTGTYIFLRDAEEEDYVRRVRRSSKVTLFIVTWCKQNLKVRCELPTNYSNATSLSIVILEIRK